MGLITLVMLPALMLQGCSRSDPQPVEETVREPRITVPTAAVTGFGLFPAPEDTIEIRWTGEGPSSLSSTEVSVGDSVGPGDTLLTLSMDLYLVELERITMETSMAEAGLEAAPGDSAILARIDSLRNLGDSLAAKSVRPLLSPSEGAVLSIPADSGSRVLPDRVLLRLSSGPGSLILAESPPGVSLNLWPATAGEMHLVETAPGGAVYSGIAGVPDEDFSRVRSISKNALFEDGLRTFLITGDGDTLDVVRAGTSGSGVIVLMPDNTYEMEFLTWGT